MIPEMSLLYSGKTKDLLRIEEGKWKGKLAKRFKDTSTGYEDPLTREIRFDSGYDKVVGEIEGKGVVSCQFTKHFFELLGKKGIPTDYIGTIGKDIIVSEPAQLFGVRKSVDLIGAEDLYNLEWVFRFYAYGSFWRRYPFVRPCQGLDGPLVEIYAKGKAGEPDISIVEDVLTELRIMKLQELEEAKNLTQNVGNILYAEFAKRDLNLIDGKIEIGKRKSDSKIILIDDVSPDVIRVCRGAEFDKNGDCKIFRECIETKVVEKGGIKERIIVAKNQLDPDELQRTMFS